MRIYAQELLRLSACTPIRLVARFPQPESPMPQAIPPDRQMVARFGAAAVAAGLMTPAVTMQIAECNRLVVVYIAVQASHASVLVDGHAS
jgi:hypothetical protein